MAMLSVSTLREAMNRAGYPCVGDRYRILVPFNRWGDVIAGLVAFCGPSVDRWFVLECTDRDVITLCGHSPIDIMEIDQETMGGPEQMPPKGAM